MRRHSSWQEKIIGKLWLQGIRPLISVVTPSLPQPTRLTPQQLEEKRAEGICYSYDRKYSKGDKCDKKKLFYIYYEEEEEKEQEMSKEEDTH